MKAASPALAPAGRTFDFLESKIQVPALRPGTISRTALVNRLRVTSSTAVATVIAPAGYGKTTLLAQWAARDGRHFAWVTLDERDNDPVVLLQHIAAALERDEPVEPRVLDALEKPGPSIWTKALPRLAGELLVRDPLVLVLDDFNLLRSRASLQAVAALVDDEAERSLLVVVGRTPPRLPLAPLRATGRLLELGMDDLAMTKREAELLLREAGVGLSAERTAEIVEQCEGWPAALYLAALSIRDGKQTGAEVARLSGDDRYLADYFRSEYLSRLRPGPLRFLRRTSVLDRMSGPLCDAVLRDEGSAQELEKIERANLFLVPLDNRRRWYRYHHLFRDLLLRELEEHEPDLVRVLHGRAADWFDAHGDHESALEHAYAAGDMDRAAAILAAIAFPIYASGRVATLERWLKRFADPALLERYPQVALHGCSIHALRGRAEQAQRWLEAAARGAAREKRTRDGSPIRAQIAVMRAWLCRDGAEQMLADAEAAVAALAEGSSWRASALVAEGSALMLLGDNDRAEAVLSAAIEAAAKSGAAESHAIALAERSLLAAETGEHELADTLAESVDELVMSAHIEGYPGRACALATSARLKLRHGHWNEARAALTEAQELLPFLTAAIPWIAVRVRLELARAFVTLRDAGAARQVLDEVDELLEGNPGLASLAARTRDLRLEVDAIPEGDESHHAGLTPAELRLFPLLATHLSFREIADQLFVSRNTIKTQAISVYRKLGVSSRSEAVAEAQRLGLDKHLRVVVTNDR